MHIDYYCVNVIMIKSVGFHAPKTRRKTIPLPPRDENHKTGEEKIPSNISTTAPSIKHTKNTSSSLAWNNRLKIICNSHPQEEIKQ